MYLTVQALVLRVTPYKDHDALLTLLTREHGKLTAKVRGLRRKNNPLTAACQLLAHCEFTLFEYRGMYTVNEAHPIMLFMDLRNDICKLSLGTYFVQVADIVCLEDVPNPDLQSLVLNSLYALSNLNFTETQVKSVFELRCACIAGYFPDLRGCFRCGNPFPERFNVREGRLECIHCRDTESDGLRMPVLPGTIDAMRYICFADSKRLFAFTSGEESVDCLSQIAETYLSTQLERGFSALDFYKSLLMIDGYT